MRDRDSKLIDDLTSATLFRMRLQSLLLGVSISLLHGTLLPSPASADVIDYGSSYENVLGQIHALRSSNPRFGLVGNALAPSEAERVTLGVGIKASGAHVQGVTQVSDGRICWSHSSESGEPGAVYCERPNGGRPVVLSLEGDHPGAIQAAGDVIVVPIKGGSRGDAKDGYIAFVDASNPTRLRELTHLRIRNAGSNINAAGLIYDPDRRKHHVVVSKNASHGETEHPVYISNGVRLSNPTARFEENGTVKVYGAQGGIQLLRERPGGVIYMLSMYRDSEGREKITASAIDRLWSTDPADCTVPCSPRQAHLMLNQEFFTSFSNGGAVAASIEKAEGMARTSIQTVGSFFSANPGTTIDYRNQIRMFWPGPGFRWGGSLAIGSGRNPKLGVLGVSRHGRDAVKIFYLDGGDGSTLPRPQGNPLSSSTGPSLVSLERWLEGGMRQATAAATGGIGTRTAAKIHLIDGSGLVWSWTGTPNQWTRVGEKASSGIAVGDRLYVINRDNGSIWMRQGSGAWQSIGSKARQLVASGNDLFVISSDDLSIWKYSGRPHSWQQVGTRAGSLAVHGNAIYVVNADDGSVWMKSGGGDWTHIGEKAAEVVASARGVYVVSQDDRSIWHYQGRPHAWKQVGSRAGSIVAADDGLYVINADDASLWRNQGGNWEWIGSDAISVAAKGSDVLVVNRGSGSLWKFDGTPGKWTQVHAKAAKVMVAQ